MESSLSILLRITADMAYVDPAEYFMYILFAIQYHMLSVDLKKFDGGSLNVLRYMWLFLIPTYFKYPDTTPWMLAFTLVAQLIYRFIVAVQRNARFSNPSKKSS